MTTQTKGKNILIVDDIPDNIDLLVESLRDDYEIQIALNGEKALSIADGDPRPDIVLLDVMMPEMDGFETCRRIKANPDTRDIEIIFVTALSSVEDVIRGYEAGASDYMTKPIIPDEVRRKVRLSIQNNEIRAALEAEKSLAMETAMTAMSSAGEQGAVLAFMRDSFRIQDMHGVAAKLVDTAANYGLDASVQLHTRTHQVNASHAEPMSPLEKEFLTKVRKAGRIRENKGVFVVNYNGVTMLIKNMPEDEGTRGRYRDHLVLLAEGADARLQALEMELGLKSAIDKSKQALNVIERVQSEHQESVREIMDDVMANLEEAFMSYGLTEEQETKLVEVVQHGVDRSADLYEQGLMIDEQIKNIILDLDALDKGKSARTEVTAGGSIAGG